VDRVSLPLALVFVAEASLATAQLPAQPARPPQMPPLPLTQLDDRAQSADLDNHAFSLTFAQPVALQDVLLLLVRGTSLSIVPDPSINGMFIGELKNVTVRQALGLILQPFGLDFSSEGGIIRVFRRELETRLYDVSFLALERIGTTSVGDDAGGADGKTGSVARVSTSAKADVFGDIAKGLPTIVSDKGTFNVDRKAGLVQVTDTRERLERVAVYLDAVQDRVQRQVQIEARVLEIALNDEKATALDWTALRQTRDAEKLMAALNAQGAVKLLANPRVRVLNNEPGIVKTDSMTLSITPQISADGIVTLGLTPLVAAPGTLHADMVARVADGDTVVIAGVGRDRETKERKNAGFSGGWFGRSTVVTRKHVELVVLLTPRIVPLP
jgi:type II secretory pathway component GspD/PulD (secretin)